MSDSEDMPFLEEAGEGQSPPDEKSIPPRTTRAHVLQWSIAVNGLLIVLCALLIVVLFAQVEMESSYKSKCRAALKNADIPDLYCKSIGCTRGCKGERPPQIS